MRKLILLSMIFLMLFLTACSTNKIENANMELNVDKDMTYEEFIKKVNLFRTEFEPANYTRLFEKDIKTKVVSTFPPNIKLDKRSNDGVNGNPDKPSKYFFYYMNNDKTALIKINFIYEQSTKKGIIINSIVSPADNVGISDEYKKISRPYTINKILSLGDYMISIEYCLINPEKNLDSPEDKIVDLIKIDIDFYEKLEKFLDVK